MWQVFSTYLALTHILQSSFLTCWFFRCIKVRTIFVHLVILNIHVLWIELHCSQIHISKSSPQCDYIWRLDLYGERTLPIFLYHLAPYHHQWFSHQVVFDSCDSMDSSLPGSTVCGILQARILEWVAISFSRGSSWPRDQTQVSCIAGRLFIDWDTRKYKALSDNQLFFE